VNVRNLSRVAGGVVALGFVFSAVAPGCTPASQESSVSQPLGLDDAAPTCNLGQQCVPNEPCPDLTIDAVRLLQSSFFQTRDFTATDCAIVEGCVTTPGTRTLLRFDTATPNVGTADMVLGAPTNNGCFQFSSCHNHYHFNDYAKYTLLSEDGTTVVATGQKRAFCLEDLARLPDTDAAVPATTFNCSNQGIHVGYEDIYNSALDCQWIDVTGVPPGNYQLSVTVNFAHVIPELSYDNNTATVPITIAGPADSGPPDAGGTDAATPCQQRGGCASCADGTQCGWCSTTGGCFDGTASGPTNGSCASWQWTADQCGLPDAGSDDGGPEGGQEAGDDSGIDAAADGGADATVDPCNTEALACTPCTALPTCGWCVDDGSCRTGTATGPTGSSCGSWDWVQQSCAAPPPPDAGDDASDATMGDPCNTEATACAPCTALATCGWCADDGTCRTGMAGGPNTGTCSGWSWVQNSCP
jgi:hypothetical protein